MKLCYVDESGNQESDPCLVMVGILVDAARLNRTRKEFGGIFESVQKLFPEPPSWTDDYYGRKKKQEAMDQLIDTAFTAKSHQAGLVQVADLFAYLLRRYAELSDYAAAEEWEGEKTFVAERVACLAGTMLPCSNRWATKTSSACAKWYTRLAPASLRGLGV